MNDQFMDKLRREIARQLNDPQAYRSPRTWADYRALEELLAYRRAARRLRKAWGKFGPAPGQGAVSEAVLDLLAVGVRR